jgi:hypothetical protein
MISSELLKEIKNCWSRDFKSFHRMLSLYNRLSMQIKDKQRGSHPIWFKTPHVITALKELNQLKRLFPNVSHQ